MKTQFAVIVSNGNSHASNDEQIFASEAEARRQYDATEIGDVAEPRWGDPDDCPSKELQRQELDERGEIADWETLDFEPFPVPLNDEL